MTSVPSDSDDILIVSPDKSGSSSMFSKVNGKQSHGSRGNPVAKVRICLISSCNLITVIGGRFILGTLLCIPDLRGGI